MRLSGRSARFLVERGMHAPPRRTRIGASSLRQDYGRPRMPIDGRKWRPRGGRATSSSRCSFHASTFLNVCLLGHLSSLPSSFSPTDPRSTIKCLHGTVVERPNVRACMCALDASWKCTRLCKTIER